LRAQHDQYRVCGTGKNAMRRIDQMQEGLFPMAGLEKPDDVLIKTGSSWRSARLYL
jgi:hypothetical protein